jgi:VWFA-related protein
MKRARNGKIQPFILGVGRSMRASWYIVVATISSFFQLSTPRQLAQINDTADQNGSYTVTATSKIVVLDVVVTDKKGNLVTNLTKDDFEVLEDNQSQSIKSFEAPADHALAPHLVIHSTEELDRVAPNAPATIIVLDEITERWEDTTYAHSSIKQYLKNQPKLLLQPTMLAVVDVNHMTVLHDYTQDKDAILTALDHYAPTQFTIQTSNNPSWVRARVTAAYRSIIQVAQATSGHPGHKNVIWVGRGLPKFSNSKYDPDVVVINAKEASELQAAFQQAINQLVASRVTLYTIDPRGVTNPISPINGMPSFADVAVATGGKPIYNRNDIDVQIDTSVRDGNGFYTLSYVPTSSSDAKQAFRKIRIVIKDRNLQASTRTGYYSTPTTDSLQQLVDAKLSQLKSYDLQKSIDKTVADTTLVYDGIPLTLRRTATPGQIMVWMDSKSLRRMDHDSADASARKIQVSCVSFDQKGRVLVHNGGTVDVPATALESAQNSKVGIPLNQCNSDPHAVRLRVVVQALSSGKIGAANLNLAEPAGRR